MPGSGCRPTSAAFRPPARRGERPPCNSVDTPVTLCGEMAGAPRAFVLLFGMGLRSFSMSPAFIPMIKDLTRHLTRKRAEKVLKRALEIKTTAGIQRFMAAQIAEIAPNLEMLDTA